MQTLANKRKKIFTYIERLSTQIKFAQWPQIPRILALKLLFEIKIYRSINLAAFPEMEVNF